MIEELRNYLHPDFNFKTNQGFTEWLLKSNNPKVGPHLGEDHKDMLVQVERESLQEILDILIREPLADYFWYTYPSNGGQLCYSLPHHDTVPSDALRVDKEKIKVFLRDIKIESILKYD
jgi:hypothetical protein